jgi:hypothetical protein
MNKMNPRVKAKWIAALRSGDYKQGRGQLRTTRNKFCCLGVLCNIHAQEHPEIAEKQRAPDRYMCHVGTLPNCVFEWASITIDYETRLIDMNDTNGITFKQIAAWIEKNL